MKKLKVLVVEDSQINKMLIMRTLRKMKLSFDVVTDVSDAIQKAKTENYNLIITNLSVPRFKGDKGIGGEKEGLNMLYNLSNAGINIPTIVCSPRELTMVERLALEGKGYPPVSKVDSVIYLENALNKFLQN